MEKQTPESVGKIVEKINGNPGSVTERDRKDGKEYDFAAENAEPKLVFEFVPLEFSAENVSTEEPKPVIEETKKEFSVPESFEINEKYNTPASSEPVTKIWTTYVPKFTEVSENYRMINDPRPRKNTEEKNAAPAVEKLDVAEEPKDPLTTLDPTAEVEEEVTEAIIVESSKPEPEEGSDTLNVYKFSDNSEEERSKPRERTVEDERADIDKLIKTPAAESAETPPEETVTEASEEPKKKDYTIPDPDSSDFRVHDYSNSVNDREDAPEGASDVLPDNKKKIATEFTLPIQRDGFKDKFLDSIMSIKIRLSAALFFAAVLLVFEVLAAFGFFTKTIINLPVAPSARGVVDFLFAACAFAMAIPEMVRSIKYLTKKKALPELMLPIAFMVLIGYYSVVFATGGLVEYPLYGFMFSILSVSTILASYYRTDGDFIAFKLISKSGEKDILDKKVTRNLPEENIALDGLIDEYKSRTARIFHASFITDFFKRTAVTAEQSSATTILLGTSFGVALVTGLVAYFIPGGLFAAASAATFVFLLAVPAFSILSHKLPYHDSQVAALIEDSTAVGETAYHDFSEVDVIAFDDTEIFGPDDVNLKRFMLYGDRDNMEKAMRQMCSLFAVAGGPLSAIFTNALDSRFTHKPAGNPEIEEDGLSGDVGGKRIAAGSEEYMLRHGIAIPESAARADSGFDTTKIMFAAEDGEVYAKFYIRYSFSEEFTQILPSLKEEGIVPLVYTRDPNISNELLKTLTSGSDCMRVMKKFTPAAKDDRVYNRVSAGIVTYGDKINAINLILLSKKYKKLSERLSVSEIYAMGVGAVLAIALSVFGMSGVPTVIFGLWQIAWCVVLRFVSRNSLLKDKNVTELKEKHSKDNKK